MSNLDYPISLLIAEGGRISNMLNSTGDNIMERASNLSAITRAINILNTEKLKDEKKEK